MDTLSFIVMGSLLAVIFGGCGWVIKRHWLDKEWINPGSRLIGRHIVTQFQNADGRDNIEHVIYMSEDEREEDDEGEGNGPQIEIFDPTER
ncbi:MAG: hypothetical protein KOO62_11915 [candidate division Zixibacteria bacterium]|nr:hypothetical protein [candidate division Zixibacteria bacterium]